MHLPRCRSFKRMSLLLAPIKAACQPECEDCRPAAGERDISAPEGLSGIEMGVAVTPVSLRTQVFRRGRAKVAGVRSTTG